MYKITFLLIILNTWLPGFSQNNLVHELLQTPKIINKQLLLEIIPDFNKRKNLSIDDSFIFDLSFCSDGKCDERIKTNFVKETIFIDSKIFQELITKYDLYEIPTFFIFDKNGRFITKGTSYIFDALPFEKVKNLINSPLDSIRILENQLDKLDYEQLVNLWKLKDSCGIYDSHLTKQILQKSKNIKFDAHDELLFRKQLGFVNQGEQDELRSFMLEGLDKEASEDLLFSFQNHYNLSVMKSLLFKYHTENDTDLEKYSNEIAKSPYFNNEALEAINSILIPWYQGKNDINKVFELTKSNVDKLLLEYPKLIKEKIDPNSFFNKKLNFAQILNQSAWVYYEMGGRDRMKLNLALTWVEKANKLYQTSAITDTQAHLLYSLNRKPEAIIIEKKALLLAQKELKVSLDPNYDKKNIENIKNVIKKMESNSL